MASEQQQEQDHPQETEAAEALVHTSQSTMELEDVSVATLMHPQQDGSRQQATFDGPPAPPAPEPPSAVWSKLYDACNPPPMRVPPKLPELPHGDGESDLPKFDDNSPSPPDSPGFSEPPNLTMGPGTQQQATNNFTCPPSPGSYFRSFRCYLCDYSVQQSQAPMIKHLINEHGLTREQVEAEWPCR